MPNLNVPQDRGALKVPIRPGTFTRPGGGATTVVTNSAAVDALVKLGFTRTAD